MYLFTCNLNRLKGTHTVMDDKDGWLTAAFIIFPPVWFFRKGFNLIVCVVLGFVTLALSPLWWVWWALHWQRLLTPRHQYEEIEKSFVVTQPNDVPLSGLCRGVTRRTTAALPLQL